MAARTDAGAPALAAMPDAGAPALSVDAAAPPAAPAANIEVPTFRPHAAPLPPPTPEQTAAFDAMHQAAETYQHGASDYKDAITTIVTLHYEEKKKAILGGLDREIGIEKDELKKARETAIKRLEDFVARYSGANAQPEATPDAMYRLAALYEERARSDDDPNSDLAVTLRPAIALYKRVIREFPAYNELAGIYYFLGHALNDSRRVDEAQQVWRSLVCQNHYPYPVPPDPKIADADKVQPMPQDHDDAFWKVWRNRYPSAASLKKGPRADTVYDDPYAKFGQLTYEMWRAVRLVVDTGIHHLKWDRQRAIDFFMENAAKPEHAQIGTALREWALPGFLVLFGGIFFVVGLVV